MRERRLLLIGMVLLCFCRTRTFSQEVAEAQWHYSKLDLTVSIIPEHGELRIVGIGEIEVTGAATSDLRFRINGDWFTLKFASLSAGPATVETNLIDPTHKAWRIASAHLSEPASRGTYIPIHFEIVKDRDAFPLAVKPNVAVAISDAVWYPIPLEGSFELPHGKVAFQMPINWHAASMGTLVSKEHQATRNVETYEAPGNRRRAFIAAPYKVFESKSATGTNLLYLLDASVDNATLLS